MNMYNVMAPVFPLDGLTDPLRKVLLDVQSITQAPQSLIASSLLGALSLASQGHVNVSTMTGFESPCSLFMLCIAGSGERKTTCDSLLMQPIRNFETEREKVLQQELNSYRAKKDAWEIKHNRILKYISRNKSDESNDLLNNQLEELYQQEPIAPKIPRCILQDATPIAILQSLYNWPSAGVVADEGGVIFGGRTLDNQGNLNKLWDGDSIVVDRVSKERIHLQNARLTISVMTQPEAFDNFLNKKGRLSRDNGFFARFLVTRPVSTQGTRYINTAIREYSPSLQDFQCRLKEILETSASEPGRVTLHFSPAAQRHWMDFFNWVESHLCPGGYYSDVKDAASKIADHVARIAALFHVYEGNDTTEIQLDTVQRAAILGEFYLNEFKRIFGTAPDTPQEYTDAYELERWLIYFARKYNQWQFPKRIIAQRGPNWLRKNSGRREAALDIIYCQNKAYQYEIGKTKWISLNPYNLGVPHHSGYLTSAAI